MVTACVEMNPLPVPWMWTFRLLDSSCIFRSSDMWFKVIVFITPYKHFVSFHVSVLASSKLILTFTKWGGVACETTSVHGPQCNFRPRNTTSVNIVSTTIPYPLLSAWMSWKRELDNRPYFSFHRTTNWSFLNSSIWPCSVVSLAPSISSISLTKCLV